MKWAGFFLFCAGLAFLGALIVLLTGHGILLRETNTPSNAMICDYLTLRGGVTEDLSYGYFGFRPLGCPFIIDPDRLTYRAAPGPPH